LLGVYYCPGFYVAHYTDFLLDADDYPAVPAYLAENGLPADLPSFPEPPITNAEGIFLDIPDLGISQAPVDSSYFNPGDSQIEWIAVPA
jgi:hypothetical protein